MAKKSAKKIDASFLNYRPPKIVYLLLIILGLLLITVVKKNWILAATVNNSPITNFEVLAKLNEQYRNQTLTQMINEKIILEEAKKQKVGVTSKEIADKITALETNVGGKDILDNLLSQQGQTREGLKNQLKIQLLIEKLYENEATVSAEEVEKFIAQNQDQLQATNSAGQTKEAADFLKQQKLAKVFQEKFQQLKSAAKITIF